VKGKRAQSAREHPALQTGRLPRLGVAPFTSTNYSCEVKKKGVVSVVVQG
jgi:hypothetical protein